MTNTYLKHLHIFKEHEKQPFSSKLWLCAGGLLNQLYVESSSKGISQF